MLKTQITLPHDGNVKKISYSTQTGNNLSEMQLLKNGVVAETFLLSAAAGVHTLSVPCVQGDRLALRWTGNGSSLGSTNFFICVCN